MVSSSSKPTAPKRFRWARRLILVVAATLTLILVGGAIATPLLTGAAERAHPPLGDYLEAGGLRQHVIRRGPRSAPSIVFVHGAYGASQDFVHTVFDDLSQRYDCIAWDRPGHGYSERDHDIVFGPGRQAEVLLDLIETLELEQPLLVGFSYGGAVALATALAGPDAIRGIVMLNGPSHPWPDPIDFEYRLPTIPLLGPLVCHTVLGALGRALSEQSVAIVFEPESIAPAFTEHSPVDLALRPQTYRANAEDITVLKSFLADQCERYPELRVPVTMLVSEGDRVVHPTIHSEQLEAAAPDFTMRRLPDAGHQVLYAHPAVVVEVVDDAMAR